MTSYQIATALSAYRSHGDTRSRNRVIESYLPRVRQIARGFAGRGEQLDDLVQVGAIGLIGAVDRCDPDRCGQLNAYVDRCVDGEIRRYLRDRSTVVRIPRRVQRELGRVAFTPIESDTGHAVPALDSSLADVGLARVLVASAARSLEPRERRIVWLRFFVDLSQAQIGRLVGLSQEQVSRVLACSIAQMRTRLEPEPEAQAPDVPS
jgi:RNA polymerase sigma-B factor